MTLASPFLKAFGASAIAIALFGFGLQLAAPTARAADVPYYPDPDPEPEPGPVDPPTPGACKVPALNTIRINRSLVVHDRATIGTGFEFSKTIGAILKSANLPDTPAAKEAFVKTLLGTLDDTEAENNGLRMSIDVRAQEFALNARDLLDPANDNGLVPTGLFNRFDLAPQSFSDCGEYRIVYSFKTGGGNGRFFLIFEAKLPNPDAATKAPGQKADPKACVDVAKFWAGLSTANTSTRNSRLQQFYYQGLPGITGPVVNAANYGDPLGQVRSNQFVEQPWMLREWRVQVNSSTGNMAFKLDTVKSNPLAEFYNANSNGALEPAEQEAARQDFQAELLAKYVKELVEVDQVSGGDPESVINGFGIASDILRFNEFQSESQNGTDVPQLHPGLKTSVGNAIPSGVNVTADELANRLNAITCQGCHQTAIGQPVGKDGAGNPIVWPDTLGFVHIAEPDGQASSQLSDALNSRFLPFRRKNLAQGHCVDPESVAPLPGNAENVTPAQLEDDLETVRGKDAPTADTARKIVRARAAIRAASENEPGFFVKVRRPH